MKRKSVQFRVHGPWLHRKKWRIDIFNKGNRSKRSYDTYGEALRAAHELLTGVETRLETTVETEKPAPLREPAK